LYFFTFPAASLISRSSNDLKRSVVIPSQFIFTLLSSILSLPGDSNQLLCSMNLMSAKMVSS
jgi:hypothetical protein